MITEPPGKTTIKDTGIVRVILEAAFRGLSHGVTAVEPTLAEAIEASYDMLDRIDFANKYYRADIGQRALKAVR